MSGYRYAAGTTVTEEKSRLELEQLLRRAGAENFIFGSSRGRAMLQFELHDRQIRIQLPLPAPNEQRFTHFQRGASLVERTPSATDDLWRQEVRRRWRELVLLVKAKLVAIAGGIVSFEDEFLANVVMADNTTMGDWARPPLEVMYETGRVPDLLPMLGAESPRLLAAGRS